MFALPKRSNTGPRLAPAMFVGDSVTAADRSIEAPLGHGYVCLLSLLNPSVGLAPTLNFGVNGDRVRDVRSRIVTRIQEVRPALISFMVGINDTWRRFDQDDPTSPDQFETDYRAILNSIDQHTTRLVLIDPFLLPVSVEQTTWRDDLDQKIRVVHNLAAEYGGVLVAVDTHLNAIASRVGPATLAADGVHPTEEGHACIAQLWQSVVYPD